MKKTIYIAIDKEDGEPIVSSFSEIDLIKKLDEWNGVGIGESKMIENRQIVYDGEYFGNLERVLTYEDVNSAGDIFRTTYNVWCIEID